jgi:ketosteroid isomerase-like protein
MRNRLQGLAAPLAALAMIAGAWAANAKTPAARDDTADRVAIEQLVVEYSYLLDHGRATELAALFTPDAIFDNPNLKLHAVGREAIAAYYARRAVEPRTTRHITTNLRLAFDAPDRARGTRTILYYRGDGAGPPFPAAPGSVGEYVELFKRGPDGRWRFASRASTIIFSSAKRQAE